MLKSKQLQVLACFKTGVYKVIDGVIHSIRKGEWKPMKSPRLPNGYRQVMLYNFMAGGDDNKVFCYHHIAVYLFCKGEYPEGWKIDHVDRNNANDLPDNLEAKTQKANIENSDNNGGGCMRPIRNAEIKQIRQLHSEGKSQQSIAKELNLNRLSVRYTIKNIEAGNKLKYEKI